MEAYVRTVEGMMRDVDEREAFTKWFIRKGYRAYCTEYWILGFVCPWWVKILAIFLFSPSVYYYEKMKEAEKGMIWKGVRQNDSDH